MARLRSSPSGRQVSVQSDILFNTALALGQYAPDLSSFVLIGRNPDVGAVEEDVWEGGGLYTFLTTPAPLEVVSSSASDTSNGVGARSVRITGLDANGDTQTVDVFLNGTSPVPVGTFLRVNGGLILTSGSSAANVGTVTVRTVSGATAQLVIGTGRGYQSQFIYTVPRGFSLVLGSFFFSSELTSGAVGQGNATLFTAVSRANGSGTWLRLAGFSSNDFVSTSELGPVPLSSTLPALTDFRFTAQCATASMRVNVGMSVILARDGVSFVD